MLSIRNDIIRCQRKKIKPNWLYRNVLQSAKNRKVWTFQPLEDNPILPIAEERDFKSGNFKSVYHVIDISWQQHEQ